MAPTNVPLPVFLFQMVIHFIYLNLKPFASLIRLPGHFCSSVLFRKTELQYPTMRVILKPLLAYPSLF